ncbi:hypothetical protein PL8927_830035 [Planktothrix serta PCC 8927]|uniref:Uncharacterized protein n=1 Tax=Planktothrix serta PCC 8927 TaxID=671068 RepID=A0A7Z9E480_9CYAN|nr:hypothetical protein PL8927_830035 [Planktothrix serta PCC 8927]
MISNYLPKPALYSASKRGGFSIEKGKGKREQGTVRIKNYELRIN